MTETPSYQSPTSDGDALSKVSGPGIGLIVTAAIGMCVQVLGILMNILGVGMGAAAGPDNPAAAMNMISGGFGIVMGVVGIIVGIVVLIGAMKMRKLQSYGFAMTAAIIAMIPCISPCCLLGLPFGIWALVILLKPEVKASFTA